MSWIRDIADILSPSARAERKRQHGIRMQAMDHAQTRMQRAWEAADTDRFRGDKWLTSQLSINSDIEQDLETLWDRVEDLQRNDPYASSAIQGRTDNVIGTGMSFHSRIRPFGDLISEDEAEALNNRREALFRQWAKADRFKAKQRLFEKSKATFGEGIGLMSDIRRTDSPIPLTWQIINPRRLQTPFDLEGDPNVRLGIRFTDQTYTQIVGYYFLDVIPGDSDRFDTTSTFFDVSRVTHSFEELVPGQIRGVPWLAPGMATMKDIKDYAETKLIAEQVSACTTTFIKTENPYGAAEAGATGQGASGVREEEIAPGRIVYRDLTDEIDHIDPNRPGGTYEPYILHHAQKISAGIRYPYALLTKDFRKTSFANGRLEMADGRQTFEVWQQADIDDAFSPVVERATEEMVMLQLLPISAVTYREFSVRYNAHQLKPTRWKLAVNPKQEVEADALEVDNLFASTVEKCDERETEFEDVVHAQERAAVLKMEAAKRLAEKAKALGVPVQGLTPEVSAPAVSEEPPLEVNEPQTEEIAA